MINFIICEDEESMSKKIVNIIKNFMTNQNCGFEIGFIRNSTKGVINYVKKNLKNKNIYILDINLNDDKNGIQLANEIRKYDYSGEIIFLTTHIEMVMYTFKYKLKALDFIDKQDNIEKKLEMNLQVIIDNFLNLDNDYIFVKNGNKLHKVSFCDIINIQTTKINGKLRISMIDSQMEFYGKLKELNLDERFYRSHKCCIVNKEHIKIVSKGIYDLHIVMSNGEKSPLSRNYIKGLMI